MRKESTIFFWNIEVWAVQKHGNLVDLVKSFPTNIYFQNLASIQKRTSHVKFAHLAEKSGKGSISNISTKVELAGGEPFRGALREAPEWSDQTLSKTTRGIPRVCSWELCEFLCETHFGNDAFRDCDELVKFCECCCCRKYRRWVSRKWALDRFGCGNN